ncbi:glycosyltransferase [Paraburkholderia kururiensis]|uniref:Glycosyltransferase n=1 Tax=Paraburkholderia kururiensis TaxID=984307 RepID=A0ABZ0WHC0_9BURK|nr:glycosyltransferase [Paraburkholderia kururiensis]WQD76741.1 glycosyltransferase [Paraburkholderia kururiensis]
MKKSLAIVMVHQGAELYGSDRSFLSALRALREHHPDASIDVVLPEPGPIVDHVARYASRILYDENGVLRKKKLKARPLGTLANMVRAWRRYCRLFERYDVCYVNTVVCVAAIAALRSHRGGTYVHVREIPSRFALRVFRVLLRFSRAALIYNSNATAAAFGMPGTVIHNGVEVSADSAPVSARGGRPLRLAVIGRINPWKGQQFVVDALRTLGRALPLELRIVGDVFPGYEVVLDQLRDTARACAQSVEIRGFTNDPAQHYAWADYALVPSVLPEPFGRVAIESFASGRPVIAAATGGLTEIVTHGETGFLFEPNNAQALLRVLDHAVALPDDDHARLANAARACYVNRFKVETYMRAIAQTVQAPHDAAATTSAARDAIALQRESR